MGAIFSCPKPPPSPPPVINKSQDAEQSRLDSERKEKNRQAMARKQRKQRGGIKLLLSDNIKPFGIGAMSDRPLLCGWSMVGKLPLFS